MQHLGDRLFFSMSRIENDVNPIHRYQSFCNKHPKYSGAWGVNSNFGHVFSSNRSRTRSFCNYVLNWKLLISVGVDSSSSTRSSTLCSIAVYTWRVFACGGKSYPRTNTQKCYGVSAFCGIWPVSHRPTFGASHKYLFYIFLSFCACLLTLWTPCAPKQR